MKNKNGVTYTIEKPPASGRPKKYICWVATKSNGRINKEFFKKKDAVEFMRNLTLNDVDEKRNADTYIGWDW